MTVIETSGLTMSYGRRRGIEDVRLRVNRGTICGFLGPNGAGKSTTIRILMGLMRSQRGEARILGHDCWSNGTRLRHAVGYVAGDVRLNSWLTLRTGLRVLSNIRHRPLTAPGFELAEQFRLEPDLNVRRMSRGNRQKLALILALAHDPDVLILDEPTSGLDPLMQDALMQCLRIRAAAGRTILFSSHTLSEVEALCDQVTGIRNGRIVEDDSLARLQGRAPRHVRVQLQPAVDSRRIVWPESVRLLTSSGTRDVSQPSGTAPPTSPYRAECLLELHGSAMPFLTWAATQPFADVTIGPPSLEELFRTYYLDSGPGSDGPMA
jgi:ABC-2 type transport system ATP-binding protein